MVARCFSAMVLSKQQASALSPLAKRVPAPRKSTNPVEAQKFIDDRDSFVYIVDTLAKDSTHAGPVAGFLRNLVKKRAAEDTEKDGKFCGQCNNFSRLPTKWIDPYLRGIVGDSLSTEILDLLYRHGNKVTREIFQYAHGLADSDYWPPDAKEHKILALMLKHRYETMGELLVGFFPAKVETDGKIDWVNHGPWSLVYNDEGVCTSIVYMGRSTAVPNKHEVITRAFEKRDFHSHTLASVKLDRTCFTLADFNFEPVAKGPNGTRLSKGRDGNKLVVTEEISQKARSSGVFDKDPEKESPDVVHERINKKRSLALVTARAAAREKKQAKAQ